MSISEKQASPFRLEALVDFPDDALVTAFTHAHLDSKMRTLKQAGVTRVSWSYYGDGHGGYLIPAGFTSRWDSYAQTLRSLENPLQAAVEAAHRHGIELYAYFKPYETGPGLSLPEGSPEAKQYGLLQQQGGRLTWLDGFVVDNPQLRIQHRPDDAINTPRDLPICALKLVKGDDAPTRISAENLQIWTSEDNHRYRLCKIDFSLNESIEVSQREVSDVNGTVVTRQGDRVRTMTLSGFQLTDAYILVTTDFSDGTPDFQNTGTELLVALDNQGTPIPGVFATGGSIWERQRVDFRDWGLIFDTGRGQSVIRLDEPNASGRNGLIAFTRGRNEYLPGALCETEPEVQAYWLSCMREMLDVDVDGIDFRVENHGTHTDYYEAYGYNPAVLEACAQRGNSDPETVAEVRGEAYTQFLRDAKRLVSASGKQMRINLNIDWFRPDLPPARRLAYPANIKYDWERWVDEGLLDEGILRLYHLPFDAIFTDPISGRMIDRCQARGVPLVVNRYINPDYPEEFQQIQQDERFGGFILYETAGFLEYAEDGTCRIANDSVLDVSRKHREAKDLPRPNDRN